MNIGDLVRCNYQPGSSGYDDKTKTMVPMKYHIKGELGLVVGLRHDGASVVLFAGFGYEHVLSHSALELIS